MSKRSIRTEKAVTLEDVWLGPFRLVERIGAGGMAEVWRGYHGQEKVPVAIKFVTGEHIHRPGFRDDFENEVRAVAMMAHPGIIRVYDYGIIGDGGASSPFLEARRGLPYLVMEYASLGSLEDVALPLGWGQLRTILRILLESLAHAHARQIIHRDLKPANVLLHGVGAQGPWIRLSDFGIAHRFEGIAVDGSSGREVSGTPHYMAPEQFEGKWRDFGPWTDLYALGCLAYQLATGKLPFEASSMVMLYMAHVREPFPALSSEAYPPEFGAWLARMVAKRRGDRFQHAADAAWHLSRIPGAEESLEALVREETWRREDTWENQTQIDSAAGDTLILSAVELAREDPQESKPESINPVCEHPPMPASWKQASIRRSTFDVLMSGTGLGLYGLRAIPVVGRHHERDRLWDALCRVATSRRPQLLILEGSSGSGKSRLARWVMERAGELGVAQGLAAVHYVTPSEQAGLTAMFRRHLHTEGLELEGVHERLRERLADEAINPYEMGVLASILTGGDGANALRDGIDRRAQDALFIRLLERLARRPLILCLDDLQWGLSSIEFIEELLGSEQDLPLLIVGTVRDEALPGRPEEARALDGLSRHRRAERMTLGPLDEVSHRELVEELLGLEPELATEIVRRTAGNPFFAVQLVGDWVERGILAPSPRGYVVRPGETLDLPEDIHRLWSQRFELLAVHHGEASAQALEIAALMGQEIDGDEWAAVCAKRGVGPEPAFIQELFAQRFIVGTRQQWAFAHAMLRESIEERARKTGRGHGHHQAIAEVLMARHRADARAMEQRLALHLEACGRHDEAASLYLAATQGAERRGDYRQTLYLSRRGIEALEQARIGPDDPRRGAFGVLRASVLNAQILFGQSYGELEKFRDRFDRPGWEGVKARAREFAARKMRKDGDLLRCEEVFDEARGIYEAIDDANGVARCLEGKAWSLVLRGRLDEGEALYEVAISRFREIEEQRVIADCLNGLSEIYRRRQRYGQAIAILEDDMALCRRIGFSRGLLDCLNSLAEIRREQGDLDAAQALYEEVIELAQVIGIGRVVVGELNLALVELGRGQFARAQPVLEHLRQWIGEGGNRTVIAAIHVGLCVCHGARGDWSGAAEHLQRFAEVLDREPLFEPDIATSFEIGVELAIAQHRWAEARTLIELALEQWRGLGATLRIQLLEQKRRGLPLR